MTILQPHPECSPSPSLPHLAAWLADHDAPCPVCSYNLRGLAGETCPECRAELSLTIHSPRTSPAAWTVAMVALAMSLGFDGVIDVILCVMFLSYPPRTPDQVTLAAALIVIFTVLAAASAGGLLLVYRSRPRWAFVSLRDQRTRAAGLFAGTFAVHLVVGVVVWFMLR